MSSQPLAAAQAGDVGRGPAWQAALAVTLLALGVGDLVVLDVVLWPRQLAEAAGRAATTTKPAAMVRTPEPASTVAASIPPAPADRSQRSHAGTEDSSLAEAAPAATEPLLPAVAKSSLPPMPALQFDRGQASLTPAAREALARVADLLRSQPEVRLGLIGHTDDLGTAELNQHLSLRRSRAAADWLSAHGIEQDRIEVLGFGADRPLDQRRNAMARARNRRVEIEWR